MYTAQQCPGPAAAMRHLGVALTILAASWSRSAPAAPPAEGRPSVNRDAAALDAHALAAGIDQLLAQSWAREKVEPAPPADDAEFVRRAYVDLAGKIPPVAEVRAFLDDPDPEKRRKLVERLLSSATFPAHFARTWRDLLLPGANNNFQTQFLVPQFEAWLRLRLASNTPYDKLVAELLTATSRGPVQFNPNGTGEPSPAAFYQVNELKPENLAAASSRILLGVQLQCAQCHNHPFAKWSREQFWGFASFFSGVAGGNQPDGLYGAVQETVDRRGLEIPGTGAVAEPQFLDGSRPQWQRDLGKRATLAQWITSAENSYFARAAVNRVWSLFFGRGLVDPVDDLDEANQPSQPEIFDELARQFVYHDFDLKYLVRAITATRAYQLSSKATHPSQDDPAQFARMSVRSMTAEQLFDSFVQATGFEESAPGMRSVVLLGANTARSAFLNRFDDTGPTPTDYQASILQALTLMNGDVVASATSLDRSQTLAAVLDAPFLDTAGRIETLFLAALTRPPSPDEAAAMLQYVKNAGPESGEKRLLADIFWALLNSSEFALNH